MPLVGIDPNDLPDRTSTGGQSSLSEADQAQVLELVTAGQSVSDGQSYEGTKAATKAGSVYKRFLQRSIKAGTIAGGTVRIATFPVDAKGKRSQDESLPGRGFAVYVTDDDAAAE